MAHETHTTQRRFILALSLTGLILAAEVVGGMLTGSLALLSDAAHIFLDILALALSYGALRMAARPADDRHTYGYHRLQVLAALANGATLPIVAFGIFREALLRMRAPEPVLAGPMLVVAVIGLLVNIVVAGILHHHDEDDLNVRSAFLHVMGDLLASIGVIVAGVIILLTGWTLADPIVSALIGVIIVAGAGRVLRESIHILVEGTPRGLSPSEIAAAMSDISPIIDIHDLHVWTVSPGYVALSAHVVLPDRSLVDVHPIQEALRAMLTERFNIHHTTIQIECAACGQGATMCVNGDCTNGR